MTLHRRSWTRSKWCYAWVVMLWIRRANLRSWPICCHQTLSLHGMGVFSVGSRTFFEDDNQYYTVTTSLGLRKKCKKCMLACFQDVPEIPPRVLLHWSSRCHSIETISSHTSFREWVWSTGSAADMVGDRPRTSVSCFIWRHCFGRLHASRRLDRSCHWVSLKWFPECQK